MKVNSVAGILYTKNLASVLNSELNRIRFNLIVTQLSQVWGCPDNEVRSRFARLHRKHENEWKSYLDTLGPNLFVFKWLKELQYAV